MAQIAVEESEWLSQQAVSKVVNQMLNHPKARPLVLQARKESDPNAVIPEIDAVVKVKAEFEDMRALIAQEKADRAQAKMDAEEQRRISEFSDGWKQQKSKLRNSGWSAEGVEAVEAFAQENGVADLTIAADAYEKRNPPPEPVHPNGFGSFGFFDRPEKDVFVKSMLDSHGENEGALDAEIRAVLSDCRSQSGARR